MVDSAYPERRAWEQLPREELRKRQLSALNELLAEILPSNRFYADKFGRDSFQLGTLDELTTLPFTTKRDFTAAAEGDLPANHTYAQDRYVRFHRTSGTRGRPLTILDTPEDWRHWIATWQFVLDAAEVTPEDRALMAFSFGPFIGFWSAYDALAHRGAMVIPCGGLSTLARLELLLDAKATIICCTPTYALRMQEVAASAGIRLDASTVRTIIVSGEPGGSLPFVRQRIEAAFDARVVDHAGATEVGPWGYGDLAARGLRIAECDFIAEFLPLTAEIPPPATPAGSVAEELVLTSLRRRGMPVIRYRTGDLVIRQEPTDGNQFLLLEGGILGRTDDMLVIRGVNVFPSAIESILRELQYHGEFRIVTEREAEMDQLRIEIESPSERQLEEIRRTLRTRIGLRMDVRSMIAGTLPRFEAKSRRVEDRR